MRIVLILLVLFCAVFIKVNFSAGYGKKFNVMFEWQQIEFIFKRYSLRSPAITSGTFVPRNVMPISMSIHKDRAFLAFSRLKTGVPASLGVFDIQNASTKNPWVSPYPNWDAHNLSTKDPVIVSPVRVRVDVCNRLWILDVRTAAMTTKTKYFGRPQLLVYNLVSDTLLTRHILPLTRNQTSLLRLLVLDDVDCSNSYAYFGITNASELFVYSLKRNRSSKVDLEYVKSDTLTGRLTNNNHSLVWNDIMVRFPGLRPDSVIYFNPKGATIQYNLKPVTSIPPSKTRTRYLKNVISSGGNQLFEYIEDHEVKLFFNAMPHLNAISCWSPLEPIISLYVDNTVYASAEELEFPTDLAVNQKGNLWVLTNNFAEFRERDLNPMRINFRILMGGIKEIVTGTLCDFNWESVRRSEPVQWDDIYDEFGYKASTKSLFDDECIYVLLFLLLFNLIYAGNNVFMLFNL